MNTEHEIDRIRKTLGTFIAWSATELGSHNVAQLLNMLSAPEEETYNGVPEDPNCLEGPGRTPEEVAQNARELDAVAPTPADKFALMFGASERQTMLELLDYPNPEGLHPVEARWRDLARELRKERDEARSLVAAFEKAVNQHCTFDPPIEKDRAISEVDYIFRLNKEIRERVEKVIGHWRDTDWFREGGIDKEITVGVNEAEAIKLLKYLKP